MDSPVIEKKFSSGSQKYVGNSTTQQNIQRNNFLVPKEEQPQLHLPYRGHDTQRKSPLKPQIKKHESSMNQREGRGFSQDKQMMGLHKNKNGSYDQ